MGIDVYSTKIYRTMMGNGPNKSVDHLSASASAGTTASFIGPVAFRVGGTLGGGTAYVQALVSGTRYTPVVGTSATEAADYLIDFPQGSLNTLVPILSGGANASCDIVLQAYSQ